METPIRKLFLVLFLLLFYFDNTTVWANADLSVKSSLSIAVNETTVIGISDHDYARIKPNNTWKFETVLINPQTITFASAATTVYGNADFAPGATSDNATIPVTYTSDNAAVATIVNNKIHVVGAGTATITAAQAGDASYSAATPVQQILTVNQAPLTIIADSKTKTFGSANPVLTLNYTGFVNDDNSTNLTTQPTINTTATTTSAVGTYPITVAGAAAANYQISYVNGSLTIAPGIQIITFTVAPKTYGDADFTLNATASSGLPVTYSSSNTAIATVDANGLVHIVKVGNVTISALQAGDNNYTATTRINQQLTINPAPLTVTADNQTKTYGAANPVLTVIYSGFVNNDMQASLTVQPIISTTATTASVVGSYPVTASGAAGVNYTISYQPGTLTIEQSSQTITFAALPNKTYGDADFNLSASATSGSPIVYISSNPSIATVDADGKIHIISAGTTIITASQSGNSNYNAATDVSQTLTVDKANLTLAATNQTKTYGAANPDLTFNYTGFVNNETQAVISAQPIISTTATAASAVGTYPITITGATAANYNIIYADANLMVVKAALTVTANNQTKAYGLANPVFTVTYNGFVNGDVAANLDTPPTVNTTATTTSAAGDYPITASGAAATNYTFAYVPGTLTITNATVNSVSLAQTVLLENQPAGTLAGTLNASSLSPNAVYTYSLLSGTGSADNAIFSIQGDKLLAIKSVDFEQQAIYKILIRATNQYGLYLDQQFTINLNDVNEMPTMAAVSNQTICYTATTQNIQLTGITPGPETAQISSLTISSTNPDLFKNLSVTAVSGGTATLSYQLAGSGTAVITITNKDNGGTANGGTDSFSQTFTVTANDTPVAAIASAQGTQILKGQTVTLTASGGTTYSWDTAFGITGSTNAATIQVRPIQTTTYQVNVSNASGCSTVSSITINVADDYASIHPTNILTPNGDGKNDTWVVKNIDLYPNNTVSIFDRGGRKVKEIKSYNNDWDGSLNGSPLAEGTYYYVIDFGSGVPIKGFITILRNR